MYWIHFYCITQIRTFIGIKGIKLKLMVVDKVRLVCELNLDGTNCALVAYLSFKCIVNFSHKIWIHSMFKNMIGDATLVSTLANNVSTFFQILHHWTIVTFVVQSSVLRCESWLEHKLCTISINLCTIGGSLSQFIISNGL
jgi:hypothetical protein